MGQITVSLGDFNKTSTGSTVYGPTLTFNIPANSGITGCTATFVTHVNSGSFQDKAFTINGQRASDSWISSNGAINVATLVTGSNTFRVSMKAQAGKTATWSISNIQLTITYNDPQGGGSSLGLGTVSTSASSVNAGSSIVINVSACDSIYTRAVVLRNASKTILQVIEYNIGTSARSFTFNVPMEWCASLAPNSTSATLYASVEVYQSGTHLTSVQKSFAMTVPPTVVPTMTSFTATRVANVPAQITSYVQGKSGVNLAINGAAGANGSTISSYKIVGNGSTFATSTASIATLNVSGNITFTATVTDSRGRTATKTVSINVLAYAKPALSAPVSFRCTSAGAADSAGTYIKLQTGIQFSTLNDENPGTLYRRIYAKGSTPPSWTTWNGEAKILSGYDITTSYVVEIRAADLMEEVVWSTIISTAKAAINFYPSETGGARFGGYSEEENCLDVAWDKLKHKGVDVLTWAELYPVGCIYMSIYSTSPATLFGGTWSALPTGRFLRVGTGGTTGGSDTHAHTTTAVALTQAQLPAIPRIPYGVVPYIYSGTLSGYSSTVGFGAYNPASTGTVNHNIAGDLGSGEAHGHGDTGSASNVPAYYEVYAWRRTA